MKMEKVFGIDNPLHGKDVYGLELEIEHIDLTEDIIDKTIWEIRTDGSLRNNGLEFVSKPLQPGQIEEAVQKLFSCMRFNEDSYSERTSIHVHCNMQGLTVDEIKSFISVYMIFEKFFFRYVNPIRHDNIFCVPLRDFISTDMLAQIFANPGPRIGWQKYSALNILPLSSFGTVEFRHMHGNNDSKYISTWVKIIDRMKRYVLSNSFNHIKTIIDSLNTKSEYQQFAVEVFGEYFHIFCRDVDYSTFKTYMHRPVMLVKLWNIQEEKRKEEIKNNAAKKVKVKTVVDDAANLIGIEAVPPANPWFGQQFAAQVDLPRAAPAAAPRRRAVPDPFAQPVVNPENQALWDQLMDEDIRRNQNL